MRRPDHCWSMMNKQKRTDPSRTPTWSKCHCIVFRGFPITENKSYVKISCYNDDFQGASKNNMVYISYNTTHIQIIITLIVIHSVICSKFMRKYSNIVIPEMSPARLSI